MKNIPYMKRINLLMLILIWSASLVYSQNTDPELVAISGKEISQIYLAGIQELGGIANYVKKGDRVVIKPNILTNSIPEEHRTTNPELLKSIIEQCYKADAKIVSIFEHTNDLWAKCYKNTGIERIAKDAEARVLPANEEPYYKDAENKAAINLPKIGINKVLFECDVLINLAVFETDGHENISGAIKNLLGCVWEKDSLPESKKESCTAELLYYVKPALNIVEVYLEDGNKKLILSEDIVLADSYAATLEQTVIPDDNHVSIAGQLGFGALYSPEHKISQINLHDNGK